MLTAAEDAVSTDLQYPPRQDQDPAGPTWATPTGTGNHLTQLDPGRLWPAHCHKPFHKNHSCGAPVWGRLPRLHRLSQPAAGCDAPAHYGGGFMVASAAASVRSGLTASDSGDLSAPHFRANSVFLALSPQLPSTMEPLTRYRGFRGNKPRPGIMGAFAPPPNFEKLKFCAETTIPQLFQPTIKASTGSHTALGQAMACWPKPRTERRGGKLSTPSTPPAEALPHSPEPSMTRRGASTKPRRLAQITTATSSTSRAAKPTTVLQPPPGAPHGSNTVNQESEAQEEVIQVPVQDLHAPH